MNICIPVDEDRGIRSPLCGHFGSAPYFMIVDTETGACRAISNQNEHHGHGMCLPVGVLREENIDGLVVGGIGMGALNKMLASGIQVLRTDHPTVEEALAAFRAGTLRPVTPGTACGGHQGGAGRSSG